MYAAGVAPVVAYELGLAPIGIRTYLRHILHIATDFSQVWESHPPTWTSQCGLQNLRGLCSKVYLGQMGSCRTLDQTMVEKSALMSGTTDQLGVLVECPIPYYSQKGKQTTMA